MKSEIAALEAERNALRRELEALGLRRGRPQLTMSTGKAEAAAAALRKSEAAVAQLEERRLRNRAKTAWGRYKWIVPGGRLLGLARFLRRA